MSKVEVLKEIKKKKPPNFNHLDKEFTKTMFIGNFSVFNTNTGTQTGKVHENFFLDFYFLSFFQV